MEPKKLETGFFAVLFLIAAALTFFIFYPYLSAIVLALTLAIVFRPMYNWLRKDLRGHDGWASIIMVLFIILLVLGPLTLIGFQVFKETKDVYTSLSNAESGFSEQIVASIENPLKGINPDFDIDLQSYAQKGLSWLTGNLGKLFSSLTNLIINLFIGLLALFYLFRDGDKLKNFFVRYSPLSASYNDEIFEKMQLTMNSVVRGSLIVAIAQGIVAGIGFFVFGLPNPAFWGAMVVIVSLIPSIGTGLVVVPAAAYLYFFDNTIAAVGLLAWGILVVGLIDNFLRPILIERGTKIHPLLILLSVLGGLKLFGPIGFIAGPLVLSFFFTLLNIYTTLIVRKPRRVNARKSLN